LITLPARKQEVQTLIRFGLPSTNARTRCRLGYQRRLVVLLACETLLPNPGFLPHISQILAITFDSFQSSSVIYGIYRKRQAETEDFDKTLSTGLLQLAKCTDNPIVRSTQAIMVFDGQKIKGILLH
jgi:hypothetical protein